MTAGPYTPLDTREIKASAPDMLYMIGSDTALKKVALSEGGEWAGPCPFCGGKDRLRVQPYGSHEPRWLCRGCTEGKWKDAIEYVERRDKIDFMEACQRLGANVPADPIERAKRAEERAREAEARLQDEIRRAQEALAELRSARKWLEYYDNLDAATRHLWHKRGIPDIYIDHWHLGYDPAHSFWLESTGQYWQTPTLTIPIFDPGWELVNIRHRLLNVPDEGTKYRPEKAGLPPFLFIAEPEKPLKGPTLLVEGEIKGMVAYIAADDMELQVVGSASKCIAVDALKKLAKCEPVYICMDPDARETAYHHADTLGRERCRVIEIPEKIDDYLLSHVEQQYRKNYMRNLILQARKA